MMTQELGALSVDGGRCTVHFERLYDATAEELWQALTEPAQLAGWLADAPRLELRAGGEIRLDFGDGEEMHGVIREIEPLRVLEYTWPEAWESVVRFELHPRDGGVLLVLDHRALPTEKAPSYGAGWHSHLDMLDAHLAGGSVDFRPRYEELRTAYEEQVAALR